MTRLLAGILFTLLTAAGCSAAPTTGATTPAAAPASAVASSAATTSTPAVPVSSAPPTSAAPVPPPSATGPAALVIDVTIAKGKVTPSGATYDVARGQQVTINLTSDVADEVHVHGVDVLIKAAPGKPGTATFAPTATGKFEVETHKASLVVCSLNVR